MIKTLKDLNQAGRRFWAGANAKDKNARDDRTCPTCDGTGKVMNGYYSQVCPRCKGKGYLPDKGKGYEEEDAGSALNSELTKKFNPLNRPKDASEPDEGAEAKKIRTEMAKVKSDNSLSEGQKNFKLAQLEKELRQANKDL